MVNTQFREYLINYIIDKWYTEYTREQLESKTTRELEILKWDILYKDLL